MAHERHAERMPVAEARRHASYILSVRIGITHGDEQQIDNVQTAQNKQILVDIQAAEFRREQNNDGYSIADKTDDEQAQR